MTLGQKLRDLRTAKRLSMEDVARAGGTSRTLIWKTEHGETLPKAESLRDILRGIGIAEGSKEWKDVHAMLGGERTGHAMTPQALTEGMSQVGASKRKSVLALVDAISRLAPDDIEEIRKAVSRPAVVSGIRALNSLFETKPR